MKNFAIQVVGLLIVIFGAMLITFKPQAIPQIPGLTYFGNTSNNSFATEVLVVGNTPINVEIADTTAKRAQGLSGRDSLDENSGMVFVFTDPKIYQFWMKGMKIPLDFIFIRNDVVIDLYRDAPIPPPGEPDSALPIYEPRGPIDMMIEVNSGFINAHSIQIGDTVKVLSTSPTPLP
ncbi:DUF192 domain-containing protein [Patescibacteria group bacterium]|nr:DUF192 domain-containing protein [Patescibacteria group bacterium]MCL5409600.1 DUF192 domain-containing protein [Patescibacteria group bacterium]